LLVCRDPQRAESVVNEIAALGNAPEPRVFLADFRSQASVGALARVFLRSELPLHALINNAGVLRKTHELTEDGIETTFAVNYLSHFMLTQLLLPRLRAAASARIVNVASDAARQFARIDFDDLQGVRSYSMLRAYKQSKLAQVMFTFEMARRLASTSIAVNCLHPGNVETAMTVHGPIIDRIRAFLPSTSAEAAGRACADLALAPRLQGVSGQYFERGSAKNSGRRSRDRQVSLRLWELSVGLTGVPDTLPALPSMRA
jgi:NAD(P)-dependent dehydrogenase (short-subunit alcohol dehydrogenase family)